MIYRLPGKASNGAYTRKVLDNKAIFLDAGVRSTNMRIGKDNKGVFVLGEQGMQAGNEPAKVKRFTLYLLHSNNN